MIKTLTHSVAAVALAAAAFASNAANVTLNGWAYGSGNTVDTTVYSGQAGGFGGSLANAGGFDSASFIAYCIEIEESFWFGSTPMSGYSVVDGASYFAARRGSADIADRLGRLMTYVDANPTLAAGAAGSTSLQLAVWNTVYDTDSSLSRDGAFGDLSNYRTGADALLAGAGGVKASRYDVYALEKAGTQDFLLLAARGSNPRLVVPEPGSLALVLAALGAVAVLHRRRRGA